VLIKKLVLKRPQAESGAVVAGEVLADLGFLLALLIVMHIL
jgi:hypothetical protein